MLNELLELDIIGLHTGFKRRSLSPVEVLEWVFSRIDRYDHLNSYITVCYEEALQQAKRAEKEFIEGESHSLILGIPLGFKDLIHTKGIRTTFGCGEYKDFIPEKDAIVVKKLKEMGSVLVGKHNTHELAYGTPGDNSYFGPMRNTYQPSKLAGGSSGGSAAAVAAHLCWGALGTDTSGSIRIPCALCGVVGMKPTFGKVSTAGIQPLSPSMDHVGPITRTVLDNAILFEALTGSLGSDRSMINHLREGRPYSLENKIVGIPRSYFFEETTEEVKEQVLKLAKLIEELGGRVIDVQLDIPEMKDAMEISSAIDRSEAYLIHREIVHNPKSLIGEVTRKRILEGAKYRAYEFLLAQELKDKIAAEYSRAFETVDALLTPTVPIPAPELGKEHTVINGKEFTVRGALMQFTYVANFIGIPSISIPCGMSESGLPIGAQLMGAWNQEGKLYRLALSLEKVLNLSK